MGGWATRTLSSLVRSKETSQSQYTARQQRDISLGRLVSVWVGGGYLTAGLETSKAALLVPIGADADEQKTVLAVASGRRDRKSVV